MDRIWHIYKIIFPNRKAYIGLSVNGAQKRFKAHCDSANRGSDYAVHRAIRKYGSDNCRLEILSECYSQKEAMTCEKGLICAHNTFLNGGQGYNMTLGGEFGVVAEEVLQRRIATNIGKHSEPHKIARLLEMAAKKRGVKLSDEVRLNMSLGHLGVKPSTETIAKRKQWWEDNKHKMNFRSGYKHTSETIAKMSASAKARPDLHNPHSEESKAKMSETHRSKYERGETSLNAINALQSQLNNKKYFPKRKGHPISDDNKKKISETHRGKKKSPEHIEALKKAQQERWRRFREKRAELEKRNG